jgi:isoamylase
VRVVDDSFLLLINAHHQQVTFTIPEAAYGSAWDVVVDTADPLLAHVRRRASTPGDRQRVPGRAMRVLQRRF